MSPTTVKKLQSSGNYFPQVVGSIPIVVGQNFQPTQCVFHSE